MKTINIEIKCGGFSEERKKTFLILVAKSFPRVRKDWGWGKIIPIEIGIMSNVDKAGRGKTSCSAAQARGGARVKIGISWPQVRLHNPSVLPALHPGSMHHPLCHLSPRSGSEGATVRPCSVTGLAPVAQSRDGQIPATELLLSGAR